MKHLYKTSLFLLIWIVSALLVDAAPISRQQALQNAQVFLENKGRNDAAPTLSLVASKSLNTSQEKYYVFNIGNEDGYVIAAGDDCAPAILGYADTGYIDLDSLPVNLKSWLEEYAQQIQFMQENGFASLKAPKLTSSYAAIPPLMTTTWDQQDPYNQNCPDFFSYGKCVTGCVATAMAQVMYYHRANSVAQTTAQIPSYDCRTLWLNGTDTLGHIHVDAIPAGSPIDWSNMLDSYSGSATTTQKQAVANLMKYCGAAVQMNYANAWSGGSGAYSSDVPIALKSYFNYSDETTLQYRSNYSSDAAWESLVYTELSSSRPVYYSGSNSSGGHAFVCDGYDGSGYYHINWGWSGTSDGYFLLTALDPSQQGTGGSSSGYNQNQAALINAQPKSSSPSNPVLAVSISINKSSAKLNPGGTLQLTETVLPSNTTNNTVTWTTSNSSVATVSNDGVVTAKAIGNATITARTTDGSNLSASCYITVSNTIICFADANVETVCLQNWDTNGDGELSKTEAAAVTTIGTVFERNGAITSFNELQYFTGLSSIDYDAFSGCNNLTSIIIPSSVATISGYAFDYCSKLTDITIPNSVTSIGDYAYRGCSSLTSIKVESGNPIYDSRNNCNAIIQTSSNRLIVGCKNTVILNSVTAIGDGAFIGCTGITNLTIPSSITSISHTAFNDCSNLANVKVESGNTIYDSRNNCNAIILTSSNRLIVGCKNTIIPNSVTSIDDNAFNGCNGLTNLTIPNSVTSIGSYVFYDCSGLTSITIPKSVTSIGIRVFEGCSGLTGMIVENGNPKYDSRNNCNAIIETNSNRLMSGCKNTTIPNNVTSIGDEAFSCIHSLTNITIPVSIISIGEYAFHNCPLDKITCLASIPPEIYSHTFLSSVTSLANLYVPSGSLNAYQNALYWKNFISIQEVSILATSISLNKTSAELITGGTLQLTATVLPSNATNKAVTWTTSNSSVATISSNGLVTAKYPGTATITARTTDGSNLSASCSVTVKQNVVLATSISLSKTSAELSEGNTMQLSATVLPSNATNKTVTWTTSNSSVATVGSNGLVTAKAVGNATITARTTDGSNLSASCSVTVKQSSVLATSISLNKTSAEINTGGTLQLTATVLPSNATNKAVTWTTSNSSVATVSSNGFVSAIAAGTATITAMTTDGSNLSATCVINIININNNEDLAIGEWAWLPTGEPALIGQTTNDHLFVRNTYNDMGTLSNYDNVVSFKSGKVQTVQVWLDDDEIYLNDKVQALTPIAINSAGDLYQEITYNSLQCEVYLPLSMHLIMIENEDGDEVAFLQGDRMPNTSDFAYQEKQSKVVDGKEYRVYGIVISNTKAIGCHFSSKNANLYKANGALKKDDAPLFSIFIQNDNQDQAEGRLDQDMIIANTEFGFREGVRDGWEPNDFRFIYGTGGNNESQRFQLYNRIALYGSIGIDEDVLATAISLNITSAELTEGNTMQLSATVLPSNATNKTVTWTTSNSSVATVSSNGLVTAKNPGTATITARTTDGSNLSASCSVTVKQNVVLATSISLNKTSAELTEGNTMQLSATVLPSNATNKTVTWTTSNSSVATVSSNGLVTAKNPGTATITARTTDGSNLSASCSVTVKQNVVLATSISLNKTSAELTEGNTMQLSATVLPSNATNKTVTWTTSNSSVATVSSNGLVTAKNPGTATITARTTDGSNLSASCSVTVKQNVVLATSISLNKTSAELTKGYSIQLTATVLPSNATNKTVTWKSNNTTVATVSSNGLVTAKSSGTATITATTTDGTNLSASCEVTVTEDISNYDNYLTISDAEAFHGDTIVMPVTMTNAQSILSFQTDIYLPEGLEVVQEDGEYVIDPSERMTRTHSIMSNTISNGAIRVLCYSSNYKPFTGNSGDDLFYITVKVADDAEGDYSISLRNTLFTTSSFEEVAGPDVTANLHVNSYLLGDANGSGTVTVTDVVVTSQYVLELNPQPFIFEAADVNADNNITVTDVTRIAWMVLNPSLNMPMRAPAIYSNSDRMSGNDITLTPGETRTVSILLDNDMDYSAFQFDLNLPTGLAAGNFQLTDRAGNHAFDVNALSNGKMRVLCYSPALEVINDHNGALLTFDVTANSAIEDAINVDGIELVTSACQTVKLNDFAIGVNTVSSVNELGNGKTVACVDYFNMAGQQIDHPDSGVTLVVTTYTDGTRTTRKIIR